MALHMWTMLCTKKHNLHCTDLALLDLFHEKQGTTAKPFKAAAIKIVKH